MDHELFNYHNVTPFLTGNLRASDAVIPAGFELEESRAHQRALDASSEDLARRYAIHARFGQALLAAESRGEETQTLQYNQRLARAILNETAAAQVLVNRIAFDEIIGAQDF